MDASNDTDRRPRVPCDRRDDGDPGARRRRPPQVAGARTLRRRLSIVRLLTRVGPGGMRIGDIGRSLALHRRDDPPPRRGDARDRLLHATRPRQRRALGRRRRGARRRRAAGASIGIAAIRSRPGVGRRAIVGKRLIETSRGIAAAHGGA